MNRYRQYDPSVLRKLQETELSVLKEFIRICQKYGIRYFALFGTNIGAARHRGFIPWDDDIDIGMLREDYEKLLEIVPRECGDAYRIVGPDSPEKFYNLVPHFCKTGTRFATNYDHGRYTMGIGFDIFVYDYLADDEKQRKKQVRMTSLWRSLYLVCHVDFYRNSVFKEGNLLPRLAAGAAHRLLRRIPGADAFIYRQYLSHARAFRKKTAYVTQFCDTMALQCAIAWEELLPLAELDFEDIRICVPREYDKLLTRVYGDYMELPPEEKRQNHYPYLLDFGDGQRICQEDEN